MRPGLELPICIPTMRQTDGVANAQTTASLRNTAWLPIVVAIFAGWAVMAASRPALWVVLGAWVAMEAWFFPLKLTLDGDMLLVRYLVRRLRLPLVDVKTMRIQRRSGCARIARKGGGLWFCIVWSPLRVDAFADELESRGVLVERGVQLLGDWWT